jgi:hypothetical protein
MIDITIHTHMYPFGCSVIFGMLACDCFILNA